MVSKRKRDELKRVRHRLKISMLDCTSQFVADVGLSCKFNDICLYVVHVGGGFVFVVNPFKTFWSGSSC